MNVKKVMVSVVLVVMATNLCGELKIIENPAAPPGKNAGRIIVPQEVMHIIDEGEGFFFKKPGMIKIAPDESIFVVDDGQFLRFDKDGKFLNNQQKKGEGPGEYMDVQNYQKELDRKFLDEYKPPYFSDIQELLFYGEQIWVLTSVISKEKGVLVDVFNRQGVYVDNFFLKLPQVTRVRDMYDKQIIIYKKFIYTIQEDEEGNPRLVKYKI